MKVKKLTPYKTTDWYIKWFSSIVLIIGMMFTANNIYPLNLLFHVIGLIGWIIVCVMWNDRSLILVNAIGLTIYINGMIRYWQSFGQVG